MKRTKEDIAILRKMGGRDYVRELVRIRDNRTCQMCKAVWIPGTRRFDIHHVYECGEKTKAYDRIADMDGLITYCHSCHFNVDNIVRHKIATKTGKFKHSREAHQHPFYRDKD